MIVSAVGILRSKQSFHRCLISAFLHDLCHRRRETDIPITVPSASGANTSISILATGHPNPPAAFCRLSNQPQPRLAECQGMMEPVVVENKKQSYRIFQRCVDCGHERWNKAQVADCFETILDIASGDGNFTSRPVACVE